MGNIASARLMGTQLPRGYAILVYLAFPEDEAKERALFDLIKQFSKMDPEDPEWLRYKTKHRRVPSVGEHCAGAE
jgi:hypothetical protein